MLMLNKCSYFFNAFLDVARESSVLRMHLLCVPPPQRASFCLIVIVQSTMDFSVVSSFISSALSFSFPEFFFQLFFWFHFIPLCLFILVICLFYRSKGAAATIRVSGLKKSTALSVKLFPTTNNQHFCRSSV